MESLELIVGVTLILGTLLFSWIARPSATGVARQLVAHPLLEPYYPIVLMALLLASALLIALGFGVPLGPTDAASP